MSVVIDTGTLALNNFTEEEATTRGNSLEIVIVMSSTSRILGPGNDLIIWTPMKPGEKRPEVVVINDAAEQEQLQEIISDWISRRWNLVHSSRCG